MKKIAIMLVVLCVTTFAQQKGSFTDPRDGKKYRTVKIGSQIWMAENLSTKIDNSVCYGNKEANCQKYGRLYDWETAMKACPEGWYLPSDAEWQILVNFVGGEEIAGKKLKTKSSWISGNGTDSYGFAALPGGDGYFNDDSYNFYAIRSYGHWWSSTELNANDAYERVMDYGFTDAKMYFIAKSSVLSVRCLKELL